MESAGAAGGAQERQSRACFCIGDEAASWPARRTRMRSTAFAFADSARWLAIYDLGLHADGRLAGPARRSASLAVEGIHHDVGDVAGSMI